MMDDLDKIRARLDVLICLAFAQIGVLYVIAFWLARLEGR